MAAAKEEVDWAAYFAHISEVCPWSKPAWHKGLVDIVKWNKQVMPLDNYLARVYVVDLNPRRLKKLANSLENRSEHDEWLWSHPRYGGYSTPVPVLIQQDRQQLDTIRQQLSKTKAQGN